MGGAGGGGQRQRLQRGLINGDKKTEGGESVCKSVCVVCVIVHTSFSELVFVGISDQTGWDWTGLDWIRLN